jgi:hypothetical protein
MAIAGTVLGGVLAGLAGVVVEKYRQYREQRKRRKQWESRLVRLCRRLTVEDRTNISKTDMRMCRNAYVEVLPLLEDHLASAPEPLPEEVVDAHERLFKLKNRLGPTFSAIANFDSRTAEAVDEHSTTIINHYDTETDRKALRGK